VNKWSNQEIFRVIYPNLKKTTRDETKKIKKIKKMIKKITNKKMRTKSGIKTKWKKIMRDEIEKQKNQEND
jgi:hypothetical protein